MFMIDDIIDSADNVYVSVTLQRGRDGLHFSVGFSCRSCFVWTIHSNINSIEHDRTLWLSVWWSGHVALCKIQHQCQWIDRHTMSRFRWTSASRSILVQHKVWQQVNGAGSINCWKDSITLTAASEYIEEKEADDVRLLTLASPWQCMMNCRDPLDAFNTIQPWFQAAEPCHPPESMSFFKNWVIWV